MCWPDHAPASWWSAALAILRRGGLTNDEAVAAHSALGALILGFLRPGPTASPDDDVIWTAGHRLEELDPAQFPATVAMAGELQSPDPDARFRFALDVFLSGLAAGAPRR